MTFLWTLVATIVHIEMVVLALLSVPWIPSSVWKMVFQNRVSETILAYQKMYSSIIVVVLLILFTDSIREMWKYADASEAMEGTPTYGQSDALVHSRLFRAQRNFYLTGAALFLFFIIRRMIQLTLRETESENRLE